MLAKLAIALGSISIGVPLGLAPIYLPGVLAQIDVKPIAEGLGSNFLPWALAIVLVALVFVVRYAITQNTAHAAALAELNAKHSAALAAEQAKLIEAMRSDAKEQREILMQIVPLSLKLTESVQLVQQLSGEDT